MENEKRIGSGLTGNTLKLIAIVCMLIDHVAWAFVPMTSPLGIIMHIIGRITGPTMFFFIAEGYFRTHDVKRYALRLFLFGLLSWIPFSLFETGEPFTLKAGVIWTLFLGLLALWACDKLKNIFFKTIIVLACCYLSSFGDWQIFGILYVLSFGLASPARGGSFKKQCIWFSAVTVLMLLPFVLDTIIVGVSPTHELYSSLNKIIAVLVINIGCFIPLFLLKGYNGERGGKPWMKWAFYIFYPAHLLILALLK